MSKYISRLELSVRRKPGLKGLPGDDGLDHNYKIGSSIKNKAPLSGLTTEEEKIYLPNIIGTSVTDNMFSMRVREYWNNIGVPVPADGTNAGALSGLILNFTLEFDNKVDADAYSNAISFDDKGEFSKKGRCIEGLSDYILFRYCLVYSRVANSIKDVNKSPKIYFYLYSKAAETSIKHNKMTNKLKANEEFSKIITDEILVDALLRVFKQIPELYETIDEKHMVLFGFVESDPEKFIQMATDKNIKIKATILKAVEKGIITNPANTTVFYYGDNQEVFLGSTLEDAVIYFKNATEGQALDIKTAVLARLKSL